MPLGALISFNQDMSLTYNREECYGLEDFYVLGINYHNTDTSIRGRFAINQENAIEILEKAKSIACSDTIILSTCNRTEIYALGGKNQMAALVCDVIGQPLELLEKHAYFHTGKSGVYHLFKVAAGLDSQILGDYEILGQLKKAAKLAKKYGQLQPLMGRLLNTAIQASKEIKAKTQISRGTISASYAVVEKLKELNLVSNTQVLVIGTGSFGRNVARNLKIYLPHLKVSVCNRTETKAQAFAQNEGFGYASYTNIDLELPKFDVIITCAGSDQGFIINQLPTGKKAFLLDMAIPAAINPELAKQEGVELFDIDALSKIMDQTLAKRKAELPKAMEIIRNVLMDFVEWHKIYLQRWFVLQVKDTLYEISDKYKLYNDEMERKQRVQKSVNHLVVRMKKDNNKGCHFIEAIIHHLN